MKVVVIPSCSATNETRENSPPSPPSSSEASVVLANTSSDPHDPLETKASSNSGRTPEKQSTAVNATSANDVDNIIERGTVLEVDLDNLLKDVPGCLSN
jgi:hypothetical protein